jgi:hypothetical protein
MDIEIYQICFNLLSMHCPLFVFHRALTSKIQISGWHFCMIEPAVAIFAEYSNMVGLLCPSDYETCCLQNIKTGLI